MHDEKWQIAYQSSLNFIMWAAKIWIDLGKLKYSHVWNAKSFSVISPVLVLPQKILLHLRTVSSLDPLQRKQKEEER